MLIFIIDRRPMFFEGEAVGFHHFWCFQALMGHIRVKGCQSRGQGFTDSQGGVTCDSPCRGPKRRESSDRICLAYAVHIFV